MDLDLNTRNVTITLETRPDYMAFTVVGAYDFADFKLMVTGCRDACVRTGAAKALIDISAVTGDMPQIDRYNLGQLFAEVWGSKMRAGVVAPRDQINRLFENTAVNRYAQVMVHGDPQPVLEWLLAP
jgi:hypothetical protein